jgi:hypothetical protein
MVAGASQINFRIAAYPSYLPIVLAAGALESQGFSIYIGP